MPWWEAAATFLLNRCYVPVKMPSRHLYLLLHLLLLSVVEGVFYNVLQWVVVTVETIPVKLPRESDYSYSIVAQC